MLLLLACVAQTPSEAALGEPAVYAPERAVDRAVVAVTPALPESDPCDAPRPFPGDLIVSDIALASAFCADFNGVDGSLTIADADWSDLSPLSCLCTVGGNLVVRDDPNLATLAGLERLQSVTGRLTLRALDGLTDVDLPALRRVGGRLTVEPNADLRSVRAPELVYAGSVSIQYAPPLASLSFPALVDIEKDLSLYGSESLRDLGGFAALRRVGGVVYLDEVDAIVSLTGLEALREVGSLEIVDGDQLASLAGINLTAVPGILLLDGNPALSSVLALQPLRTVGTLDLRDNDALVDIQPLAGIESVTGDFIVTRNDRLPPSAAWDLVAEIGEDNIDGTVTIQ